MKEVEGFTEFWGIYPRRVAKLAAMKAYARALKMATAEEINRGAKIYAHERLGKDAQFTAHAATWLNAGRWADEVETVQIVRPPSHLQPVGKQVFIVAETPEWFAWQRVKRTPIDRRGGWWFPTQWPNGVH